MASLILLTLTALFSSTRATVARYRSSRHGQLYAEGLQNLSQLLSSVLAAVPCSSASGCSRPASAAGRRSP